MPAISGCSQARVYSSVTSGCRKRIDNGCGVKVRQFLKDLCFKLSPLHDLQPGLCPYPFYPRVEIRPDEDADLNQPAGGSV